MWGRSVTVTIVPGVDPSPEIIFVILIGSDAKAPTISNSGLWGANPSEFEESHQFLNGLDVALKHLIIYCNICQDQ